MIHFSVFIDECVPQNVVESCDGAAYLIQRKNMCVCEFLENPMRF